MRKSKTDSNSVRNIYCFIQYFERHSATFLRQGVTNCGFREMGSVSRTSRNVSGDIDIAQLVRASHRYREVTGSNPVEVLTFSGFHTQLLILRS